ncbi:hypothetical protein JR316_0006544 [Psilocybe cubensis]|uniref:CHAT domain-containing protein n=2 Tax=Psilocybe cubensis TaxID=181762 RepID=A0A8H7XMY2_PSICU|nr:hypothetical protein JR316_0006544 [Psilocybe cubensis]KAH9482014.1 hypothetical protein JR316_0006544 [Psilocybe cubensis]
MANDDAAQIFKSAALLKSAPLTQRLKASQRWAKTAKSNGKNDSDYLDAYEMAISLVSQVTGMEKTIGLRYRNLFDETISDLPNEAAAAAFAASNIDSAFEFLEQGRCIVWRQIHNLRTPFDKLSSVDQDLADDLSQIAKELESAGLRNEAVVTGLDPIVMKEKMGIQEEATNSAQLAQRWDALLAKARNIEGFDDFLRPHRYQDIIRRVPSTGYVVVINIHAERCDAIALGGPKKEALHIPLNLFTYNDAVRLVRLQDTVLESRGSRTTEHEIEDTVGTRGSRPYLRSSNPMQEILGELWTSVVNPILQALEIKGPMSDLKRIWWSPTGPLCFLPIHAAGIYNTRHNVCLYDYAVSSYIPTVNTLIDLLGQASESQYAKKINVVVVGQGHAPGLPPLPGAQKEINMLKDKFDSAKIEFSCVEGSVATMERAMKDMETFNYIHFACHAIQDTTHPLKSGFYLSDGRLELWNMLKVHNRDAELAFLSACQTARGNSWLWEEAAHLGAGMLAVGYRGTVATMWSIMDRYGAKVAEDFYSDLFNIDETVDNLGRRFGSAGSLHSAISRLRAEIGDSDAAMLAWVPYLHMGV